MMGTEGDELGTENASVLLVTVAVKRTHNPFNPSVCF